VLVTIAVVNVVSVSGIVLIEVDVIGVPVETAVVNMVDGVTKQEQALLIRDGGYVPACPGGSGDEAARFTNMVSVSVTVSVWIISVVVSIEVIVTVATTSEVVKVRAVEEVVAVFIVDVDAM